MSIAANLKEIESELQKLKFMLAQRKPDLQDRIESLQQRAVELRKQAAGGDFEPAVGSVCDLLASLHRSVSAQSQLKGLAKQADAMT